MSQNPSEKDSIQTDKMYSYNNGPNNEINENNDENNIQSQAIRRSIGGNEVENNNFEPKEDINMQNNLNNKNIVNEKDFNDNFNNFQPPQFNSRSSIIHIEANPPFYWVIFVIFIAVQIIFIIIFGFYYSWDNKLNAPKNIDKDNNEEAKTDIKNKYQNLQDITLMIFLGFGFLRSFLKHYSWSSIIFTLIGGIFCFEFAFIIIIAWGALLKKQWIDGYYNFDYFYDAIYITASLIISFGSYSGKLSLAQFFIVIIIETIFSTLNYILMRKSLNLIDIGGTLTVHLFGAVFGCSFSIISYCSKNEKERISTSIHLGYDHNSNLFALFGSLIIIPYWPSFNTALVNGNQKYRGIINTYFAVGGSIIGMFAMSHLLNNKKMKIEDLIHASFPGAIIIGGCCHIIKEFYVCILLGLLASIMSSLCIYLFYRKLKINEKGYHDTSQVLFYHGIPAILGGIFSTIFTGNLNNWKKNIEKYSDFKYKMFIGTFQNIYQNITDYKGDVNVSGKAGAMIGGLFLTILIAAFSGLVVGFAVKFCLCNIAWRYFNDSEFFDVSEDESFPWIDERVELKFEDKIKTK